MNHRDDEGRCKRGHLVQGDNAYEYAPGKFRCKQCHAEAAKKHRRVNPTERDDLKKTMSAVGLGGLWNEFVIYAAKNGWPSPLDALEQLLKSPLELLDVDQDAFKNYLTMTAMTPSDRDRMQDLNGWLKNYGVFKPSVSSPEPATDGEIEF